MIHLNKILLLFLPPSKAVSEGMAQLTTFLLSLAPLDVVRELGVRLHPDQATAPPRHLGDL
jgi:hypothetical protein